MLVPNLERLQMVSGEVSSLVRGHVDAHHLVRVQMQVLIAKLPQNLVVSKVEGPATFVKVKATKKG